MFLQHDWGYMEIKNWSYTGNAFVLSSRSTIEIKLIRGYHKGKEVDESQIEIIVKKKNQPKTNKESCNSTKLSSRNIRSRSKFHETVRACKVS